MAQQGVFTLPANTSFGVTAFANAANTQTIQVLVDNVVKATFTGSGTSDKLLGSQVLNSGSGAIKIQVSVNGKPSDLVSNQTILANKLNFAMVGSEDGTDNDYNDGIAVLNWRWADRFPLLAGPGDRSGPLSFHAFPSAPAPCGAKPDVAAGCLRPTPSGRGRSMPAHPPGRNPPRRPLPDRNAACPAPSASSGPWAEPPDASAAPGGR